MWRGWRDAEVTRHRGGAVFIPAAAASAPTACTTRAHDTLTSNSDKGSLMLLLNLWMFCANKKFCSYIQIGSFLVVKHVDGIFKNNEQCCFGDTIGK